MKATSHARWLGALTFLVMQLMAVASSGLLYVCGADGKARHHCCCPPPRTPASGQAISASPCCTISELASSAAPTTDEPRSPKLAPIPVALASLPLLIDPRSGIPSACNRDHTQPKTLGPPFYLRHRALLI
jgi:hypothetical protein